MSRLMHFTLAFALLGPSLFAQAPPLTVEQMQEQIAAQARIISDLRLQVAKGFNGGATPQQRQLYVQRFVAAFEELDRVESQGRETHTILTQQAKQEKERQKQSEVRDRQFRDQAEAEYLSHMLQVIIMCVVAVHLLFTVLILNRMRRG